MEKKQVVKRGGNREDFSPAKIRKTIERAAAGFELDLQPLEEKMADFAKDGVSTAEIAKYLTLSALSLTTVTDPDWKNAAGRHKNTPAAHSQRHTAGTALEKRKSPAAFHGGVCADHCRPACTPAAGNGYRAADGRRCSGLSRSAALESGQACRAQRHCTASETNRQLAGKIFQ